MINSTRVLKIGDVSRDVNYVQVRNERNETAADGVRRVITVADLIYDRSTGLMVRCDYTWTGLSYVQNELYESQTIYQGYVLRETNVWSEPFWMSREFMGVLDVALIVILVSFVALYLRTRMHLKSNENSKSNSSSF